MSRKNRRQFLQTSAAAGVGFWAAGGVAGRSVYALAAGEIRFGCIGIDGKGSSDTADAARPQHGKVVAICDVDDEKLSKAAATYTEAKKFHDYREMLDKYGGEIDAVTVSTPDHNHAPASVMAMRMGKHCFCQKPLTHSIFEARTMAQVAKEKKVATQMGNQGTSETALRKSAAMIKAGVIGKVSEVHVWTNRPIWPQGGPRSAAKPVPKELNWELWLGPAPYRPYGDSYHPFAWRGWWDFGTGALGDMACHTMNLPYAALNLRDPVSVQAESSGHNKDSYPQHSKITYKFPAIEGRPAVTMYWYDGRNRPAREILPTAEQMGVNSKQHGGLINTGSLFIGEKGKLFSPGDYAGDYNNSGVLTDGTYNALKVFPDKEFKYTRSPGHFTEWVNAIKGGKPAMSNFADYSGKLTETVVLGNLAVYAAAKEGLGAAVEWDAEKMTAKGAADLDKIIKTEYRKGYSLSLRENA
jgi:predicted dehydrogenase